MNWLNSLHDWLTSTEGQRLVTGVVVPFVAIVVAGVIAALIARGMSKRLLDARERDVKATAVTALISSARRSIEWSTLSTGERSHATHLSDEASIRLRLLPLAGSDLAAVWSEHEIDSIRQNSATFRFQAEQTFADLRDRLVQWQAKPCRAKKLFRDEVERWTTEKSEAQTAKSGPPATQSFVPVDGEAVAAPAQSSAPPASATAPASAPAAANPASFEPAPIVPAAPPAAAAQDAAVAAMEQTSDAVSQSEADGSGGEADPSVSTAPPTRQSTGMVTTPVVGAPAPVSPAVAESAADGDSRDDESSDSREPAFSAPVSAHQVRRRTTPDEN